MPRENNPITNFEDESTPPYNIEKRKAEFEKEAESIRAFLQELEKLYVASERIDSYNRKNIQALLGAIESALRNEVRYLENPDEYRQWQEKETQGAYCPELDAFHPAVRSQFPQLFLNLVRGIVEGKQAD